MYSNKLWILLCILFVSEGAYARFTKDELAALPRYCNPKYDKIYPWTHGVGGFYHYCGGLVHLNKYYTARTEEKRRQHYREALGEFNYSLIQNKRYLPRIPKAVVSDMYFNRGRLYSLVRKDFKAVMDWNKALDINPRSRQAYLALANYYKNHGQKDEALKVVTKGLQHLPKSKSLRKKYRKLGGKLPYPEPVKSKSKKK